MRRMFLLPLLLVALAMGGCASLGRSDVPFGTGFIQTADNLFSNGVSVFKGGTSVTASIQNPVTREQQAGVEATYGLAASAVLNYSRLRRCKAGEVASITNLCSKWTVVQKLKRANSVAYGSIVKLRGFMDNNQTISAIGAFNSAQAALTNFKAIAVSSGVQ
jgi:hypothetical protein